MKVLLALATFACVASAAPIEEDYVNRLADAIWHAEGGRSAKVSHGILSVPVKNAAHARKVCKRTIKNTWGRWEAAGRPGDFVEFLGRRYCPVEGDRTGLNKNWLPNVRSRLRLGR